MSDRMPITVGGKQALEDELRKLKSIDRPAVIEQIAIARAHGDLSENADYAAAKEKQGFIEGRIQELNDKIARAEIINPKEIKSSKVVFGATVTLENEEGNKVTYQIVGETEANIEKGKLSLSAPLAKALLGKEVGDEVQVQSPKGKSTYSVIELVYI